MFAVQLGHKYKHLSISQQLGGVEMAKYRSYRWFYKYYRWFWKQNR